MRYAEQREFDDDPWWDSIDEVVVPRALAEAKREEDARRREAADAERRRKQEETKKGTPAPAPVAEPEWGSGSPATTEPRLAVFRRADAVRLEDSLVSAGSDRKDRLARVLKVLKRRGEYRRLTPLPTDWRALLDQLGREYPNFGGVLAHLGYTFALADRRDRMLALTPILLLGPPGVGKSVFCERIARLFGTAYTRVSFENVQTGSMLCGSEAFWANTEPGAVFRTLIEGDCADALFQLDELDKCAGSHFGDPRDALLALLEPGTAKDFKDLSVPDIPLNASRLLYIATANELRPIPLPLRSRMSIIEVRAPNREQSVVIASSIYRALLDELVLTDWPAALSEAVLSRVATLSPRRMRQVLREAIGRALYEERGEIDARDVVLPPESRTVSVGFV